MEHKIVMLYVLCVKLLGYKTDRSDERDESRISTLCYVFPRFNDSGLRFLRLGWFIGTYL